MSTRVTIDDVAKLAGVAKCTVSSVLNGRSANARISDATRERVLSAAAQLSYKPNALGRMLATRRADAIGLVFQYAEYFHSNSTFIPELMRGVCEACVERGVDVLLHTRAHGDPAEEASNLLDGRVDGSLVLRNANDPTLQELARRKFPMVLFFSRSLDGALPFVDSDNYTGGQIATRHLIELGHCRIGMVRGALGSVSSDDRFNGYRQAMELAGLPTDPTQVCFMESPHADPGPFMEMMSRPDHPTALFVWSDDAAFVCLRWLSELGLSVPGDVSVIGFDSTPRCESSNPPLTSVRQPVFEIAREAARLLIAQIRSEPVERDRIVFPPDLEVRSSTAPPRTVSTNRR